MKIFALIVLTLVSYSVRSGVIKYSADPVPIVNEEVYVVNHGWHTGFVVPAKLIQTHLEKIKDRFPTAEYIEFGWGDKGFYQAQEITLGLIFQAIFWPTESVIHAVAVTQPVETYFKNSQSEKLCLSSVEYTALINFIENSFRKKEAGTIVALQRGIYGDSQFYEARDNYHMLNTCNKWTAKGLKSAGLNISPVFKLTADSVMSYLQENRKTSVNAKSCK